MAEQLFKSKLGFATDAGSVINSSNEWLGADIPSSKISGLTTYTDSDVTSLLSSGSVASINVDGNVTINGATGVVTAVEFVGDGSGLTGLTTYTDSDVTSLLQGGISTPITTSNNVQAGTVYTPKVTGIGGQAVEIESESGITLDTMGFGSVTITDDATVGGNLTVTGNLTVNGTTTTLNTATLDVEDLNITVAKGAADAAAANGAGLTIDGANATLTWDNANIRLAVNKSLYTSQQFIGTTLSAPSGQDLTLSASSSTRVKIFTGQTDVLPRFDEDVYTMSGTTANQSLGYITGQGITKVILMAETSGGARHAMEVLIVSNGTDANFTTYGEIYTADLGEFSLNQLDSINLEMRFSPTAAGSGCTVTVMRQWAVSQFNAYGE